MERQSSVHTIDFLSDAILASLNHSLNMQRCELHTSACLHSVASCKGMLIDASIEVFYFFNERLSLFEKNQMCLSRGFHVSVLDG